MHMYKVKIYNIIFSSDTICAVSSNRFLVNEKFDASMSIIEIIFNDEKDNFPILDNHSYFCAAKKLLENFKMCYRASL